MKIKINKSKGTIQIPRWMVTSFWSILILGFIGVIATVTLTDTTGTGFTEINSTGATIDTLYSDIICLNVGCTSFTNDTAITLYNATHTAYIYTNGTHTIIE